MVSLPSTLLNQISYIDRRKYIVRFSLQMLCREDMLLLW